MRRRPLIIINNLVRLARGLLAPAKRVGDGVSGVCERREHELLNVRVRVIGIAAALVAIRVSRAAAMPEP